MVHRGRGHAKFGQQLGPAGRGATRCRWLAGGGQWEVHARVERFVEPALLLLLRDGETHGYELADALAEIAGPDERVDLGNLYRLLRRLELEGIVTSRWRDDLPGRSKRTYELTEIGERLLDAWVGALRDHQRVVERFLTRYEHRSEEDRA
jgi:poly-beta-hydroxybutyrate-responsive repressor